MYIPTGIKIKLLRSGVNCNQMGQIVRFFRGGSGTTHSSGQTTSSFSHIEGISLDESEETCKFA